MKREFCVFDVSNLIYRVANAEMHSGRNVSPRDAVGLALAMAVRSMRLPFSLFNSRHVVACFDHYSWRRDHMESYKANRRDREMTESEQELKSTIQDAITSLREFLHDGSNVTVLWEKGLEADDLIARFTALHAPLGCNSVIVSSDTDFKQLVDDPVWLYNATSGALYRPDGVFEILDGRNKTGIKTVSINERTWKVRLDKEGAAEKLDPKWELFEKIMRGDKTDNVPGAAVPRTRTALLEQAFKNPTGPAMQDVMSARRNDLLGRPTVREMYDRNRVLIDLTAQPAEIRDLADQVVVDSIGKAPKKNVIFGFAEFCRKWGMVNLLAEAERFAPMLSARYA